MKILLLEDDLIYSELIANYLKAKNHDVQTVYDGEEAEEYIYFNKFDLLLLDINVPHISGLEVLKRLRGEKISVPVIFLTSEDSIGFLEQAYSIGCNDYLKKPFELKELIIRINYLNKTHFIENKLFITISDQITLDMSNLVIIKNKETFPLSKKEANILKYFFTNKNKIIDMDELIVNVWEYNVGPSIATIRTYIKNIRKIIGSDYFTTIKGSGYRFNI